MAEQNKLHESVYNLNSVGNTKQYIDNYIITSNSKTITDQDGKGNIIVLISNGNGVTTNDINNINYVDLYVGDEHIAGGLGFKNINERNEFISYTLNNSVKINKLSEDLVNYDNQLTHIENTINNIQTQQLNIDETHNYLYVNDKYKYVFDIDNENNILGIYEEPNFIINEVKIYFDIYENDTLISTGNYISYYENKQIYISNKQKIKITNIVTSFEHHVNMKEYKLYYNLSDISVKTPDSIINISGDKSNNYTVSFSDNSKTIYKHDFETNNYYENLTKGKFNIDVKDNNYEISYNNENKSIELFIKLYDENYNYCLIRLPKIFFISPIYYFNSETALSIDYQTVISHNKYIIPYKENDDDIFVIDLNFESDNKLTRYYNIVAIPSFLVKNTNTKFILNKQLQVELVWNMKNQQIKINEINYYVLSSPNKYIGDINWILKL